jgi:hypothetical protein
MVLTTRLLIVTGYAGFDFRLFADFFFAVVGFAPGCGISAAHFTLPSSRSVSRSESGMSIFLRGCGMSVFHDRCLAYIGHSSTKKV